MLINNIDTNTAVTIGISSTLDGILSVPGESDLYRVTLQAGNAYSFSLDGNEAAGNGLGAVSDTYLSLYDANGTFLSSNDDGHGGLNSLISNFSVNTSGIYYLEAGSYAGLYSGGYQIGVVGDLNVAPTLSGSQAVLPLATIDNTYFISSANLLQGFTDANSDTMSISGSPTVSNGSITAVSGGWNVTGLTTAGDVNVSYTVTDSNGGNTDATNSFAVTSAANAISMTRMGANSNTSEDGGTVSYNLALNNALTVGSIAVTVTTRDATEGQIVQANGTLGNSRTYTLNSSSSSRTVEIAGIQDYINDGTVGYQIQIRAVDSTATPSRSGNSTWTSAIRDFNSDITTGYRYENLYNRPDFDSISGNDRDVSQYLVGDIGRPQEDTLVGLDGSDRLYGGYMIDTLHGGIGNDRLYGGYEDDQLYGGDGNDLLYGEQDDDYLNGGAGNDRLDGGIGADTMVGGAGSDTYYLTLDDDGNIEDTVIELASDAGTDTVYIPFQVESYTLTAGVENVRMNAGFSNTELRGNASDNTMVGNAGNNSLTAGSGNDTINAGSGNDNLLGGNGTDTLNGGNGADFLDGGNGIDLLNGGDGNDNLCGGLGNDNLIGGTGSDTLTGGAGVDTLNGGAGRDNFVFDSRAFEDRDIIADFNVADDQIGLRSSIVTEVGGTVSAAEFVNVTSGGATNADQRLIYNSTNGGLYYDADGNGSGSSAALLGNVGRGLALTYRDFYIV